MPKWLCRLQANGDTKPEKDIRRAFVSTLGYAGGRESNEGGCWAKQRARGKSELRAKGQGMVSSHNDHDLDYAQRPTRSAV